jgi:hypothetical protein
MTVAQPHRAMRRVPQLLVFALVQPLIFVFMFRYVFGGAISRSAPKACPTSTT